MLGVKQSKVKEDIKGRLSIVLDCLIQARVGKKSSLACLSQRLPIEFNSTNHLSQEKGRKQVEGRMRVCLKIDAAFETMTTTSSSEPILSEGGWWQIESPYIFRATEGGPGVV